MRLKFVSSQLPNFSCKRVRTECLKGFKHSSAATFMVSPREGGVNHTVEPTFCPIPLMGFSSVKSSTSSAETGLENALLEETGGDAPNYWRNYLVNQIQDYN